MNTIAKIEQLISQGRNFEALNQAKEALKTINDIRLSQLYAIAVSKSGAPQAAMEFMEPVYRQNQDDPETAGILGGIYKELFKKDQNTKYAILSRDTYIKNFATTKNYYTGINAATMSAIAGQAGRGREIAGEVIAILGNQSPQFWELATLGEASLLTKNREKAIEYYIQAKKLAGTDWGKIQSVHNQLWLLNHYVAVPTEILKIFSPPGVVAFAGHMIDHPSRQEPRFPESISERIKESIASAIKTINAKIGYSSLACGSDILFAEAMAEAGGEVNVWLPFAKEDFVETSLRFAGETWVDRFNLLIERFPVTFITEESYEGYDELFSFQSTVIFGSSIIRSAMNHTKPSLLTVLSETDLNRKEGGTRDTLNRWPYVDRHVNVNPDHFLGQNQAAEKKAGRSATATTVDRPILYGVCADIPGLSPADQAKIWSSVKEKMEELVITPVTFEVREELIGAFSSIVGALELTEIILSELQDIKRLPQLRISLYASPAFLEPSDTGEGKQLMERSRIKLKGFHSQIPAGAVYALARFASVLALDVNKYSLDYAGLIVPPGATEGQGIYTVKIND